MTNRYQSGNDHYKLLPTQGEDPSLSDRENFMRITRGEGPNAKTGIGLAYQFFQSKLQKPGAPDLEALHRVVVGKLTLVSIILDEHDNPHRIFESLNGKGRPLSQADLIRNYFFMRIDAREHDRVYVQHWRPMQKRLGDEAVAPFVRHYLMGEGPIVRETDVYSALKARVDKDRLMSPLDNLRRLDTYSQYYSIILRPEREPKAKLRERLVRLNRLEVTVAYPFLLNVYADHARDVLSEPDFIDLLDTLESFLVRRFVCAVPTHGLNKISRRSTRRQGRPQSSSRRCANSSLARGTRGTRNSAIESSLRASMAGATAARRRSSCSSGSSRPTSPWSRRRSPSST